MTTITNTGVTTTDLAVDTDTIKVDSTNDRVYINRTAQSTNHDALVVSSPAGGVGGGVTRVNATVTAEDLTGDSGAHANAFIVTKSKGNYYNGLECTSTSGHVGGWIGHWNGSSSDRQLQARIGGTGINASDTLAMYITSAGYVMKPAQPSFKAYRTPDSSWSITANNVFVWNNTEHNIGNCYNTSNGRFTAPIAGSYQINYHSINYGVVNNGWISLRKNGSRFNGGDVHYTNTVNYWHFSNNAMTVYLAKDDYLEVYAGVTDEFHGGNWSHFSGFLIG